MKEKNTGVKMEIGGEDFNTRTGGKIRGVIKED